MPTLEVGCSRRFSLQTNWFIVFEAKGGWWIDNEGTEFGPFLSKEAAGAEDSPIAEEREDGRPGDWTDGRS